MGEPAVGRGSVPVLYARGNIYHVARAQLLCRFAPFLVTPSTGHADEDLSPTALGVMDVPVVAAAGLERHVVDADLLGGKGREVALPDKVLRECVVGGTDGKGHFVLMLSSCVGGIAIRPDLLRHAEGRPRLGPSRVKRRVRKDFRYLRPGHPVVLCGHQMILERRVRQPLRHQGHHRHHAAVSKGEPVFSAPHLAEQHIVIELCEFGGKVPQGISARCLLNRHV